MNEYIEDTKIYTIDNQRYTVISRTKRDNDIDKIYNVLSKFALQKLNSR